MYWKVFLSILNCHLDALHRVVVEENVVVRGEFDPQEVLSVLGFTAEHSDSDLLRFLQSFGITVWFNEVYSEVDLSVKDRLKVRLRPEWCRSFRDLRFAHILSAFIEYLGSSASFFDLGRFKTSENR